MAKRPGFSRFDVEFPDDMADEMKEFARAHGLSVASFLRYCAMEAMERGSPAYSNMATTISGGKHD